MIWKDACSFRALLVGLLLATAPVSLAHADCPSAPVETPTDLIVSFLTAGTTQAAPAATFDAPIKKGMLLYDGAANGFKYCNGSAWVSLLTAGQGGVSTLASLSDVDASAAADGKVLKYNSTTTKWEAATPASGAASTSNVGYLQLGAASGAFTDSGTTTGQLFWDNTNKRLGIGTASPTDQLSVGNGHLKVQNSVAGGVGPIIKLDNSNGATGDAVSIRQYDATLRGELRMSVDRAPWGSDLIFLSGDTTPTEKFRITTNGNVGIGTTDPKSLLQVTGGIQLGDDTATCPGVSSVKLGTMRFNGGELQVCKSGGWVVAGTSGGSLTGGTSGYVGVWSAATSLGLSNTTPGQQLFWDGTNNRLGIGTASPGSIFDIVTTGAGTTIRSNNAGILRSNGAGRDVNLRLSDTATNSAEVGMLSGDLYFTNNGVEHFRISNAGNVGIGTTTPTRSLSVFPASVPASGVAKFFVGDSASTAAAVEVGSAGTSALDVGNWDNVSTKWVLRGFRNVSRTTESDTLAASGTPVQVFGIRADGNVGIGTANPQAQLHLTGRIVADNYNDTLVANAYNASGWKYTSNAPAWNIGGYSGDATAFRILTAPGGTAGSAVSWRTTLAVDAANGNIGINNFNPTEKLSVIGSGATSATAAFSVWNSGPNNLLYVRNDGFVGIGTTGPVAVLDIGGNGTYGTPTIRLANSQQYIQLGDRGAIQSWPGEGLTGTYLTHNAVHSGGVGWKNLVNASLSMIQAGTGNVIFYTNTSPGAANTTFIPSERMRIDSSGNVGIGTAAPQRKLHLYGTGADELLLLGQGNNTGETSGYLKMTSNSGNGILEIGVSKAGTGWGNISLAASGGTVGIGLTTTPSHLLQVNGIARSTQSTWATSSDMRVKTNITSITDGLSVVDRLRPVTFQYTPEYQAGNIALAGNKKGFIAQEVEAVLPDMVEKTKEKVGNRTIDDFRVLENGDFVPLLVSAVKELKAANDNQEAEIKALRRELDELKRAPQ